MHFLPAYPHRLFTGAPSEEASHVSAPAGTKDGRRGNLGLGRAALILALLWSPSVRATDAPLAAVPAPAAPLTKIVFGTDRDYPPFEFRDANGSPAGFNIELMKAVCEVLGGTAEVRMDDWPRIRRAIEIEHTVDVAAMYRTPTRSVALDFSDPFTVVYFEIFVRADSPPVNSLEDLRGRTVIVQDAAFVQEHLLRLNAGATVVAANSDPEALQWLAAGRYDCAIVEQLAGRYSIRKHNIKNLVSSGVPVLPVEYCFAVASGRDELRLRLNRGLSALRASGRYDRLREKWFGDLLRQGMTFRDVLRYAAWVLGPLAALAIAATAWSLVLRRTVARRTQELSTELSARIRAERQLHDQYSLLKAVTEGTTDAVFVKDRLGRYQMINPAGAQFLGKAPDFILGRDDTELFSADTAGPIMEADRRVLATGEVRTDEEHGTAGGLTRTFLVTKAPWRDDQGVIVGLIGVARDITERQLAEQRIHASLQEAEASRRALLATVEEQRRTEQILREGERKYASLVGSLPHGVYRMSTKGDEWNFTYLSERWCELTGLSRAAVLADCRLAYDLVHPEEQAGFLELNRTSLRTLGSFTWEGRMLVGGQVRWVHLESKPTPLDDGSVQWTGLLADVTNQRRTEDALRLSERKFAAAFESSPDAIMITSLEDRRLVEINESCTRITEYTRDELIGHTTLELGIWADPTDRERYLAELEHSGRVVEMEVGLHTRTGAIRNCVVSAEWIEIGGRRHILSVIRDVTDRKRAEAAIRQLNAELEQRVADRTAELAGRVAEVEHLNAELRASQASTDRIAATLQRSNANLHLANQELEAFSYSVSHDLRAPLRNISGFIELLRKRTAGAVDTESERFFGIIAAESVRLGRLIDSLLAFSRIGRADLKVGPVAIAELVEEVRHEMGTDLADRAIEWRIGPLPTVPGDRALLHQVIANLLGNAVKFTRHRRPALIELGTLLSDPTAPGLATFYVRDNGAGFNPAYSDKLFRVFQRLHNTSEFEGTGIGLANVKRIVVRHGGSIHAEGAVNAGATFQVSLPSV